MVLSDDLVDALLEMNRSFIKMYDGASPPEDTQSLADLEVHHMNWILALDPTKISNEYTLMWELAHAIDGSNGSSDVYGNALAQIGLSDTHLNAWTGDAADAFKLQLNMMAQFCTDQKTRMLEGIRGIAATYAAAVEARANLLNVYTTFKLAADAVIAGQEAKAEQLKWTVVADLAQGALTMNPQAMVASVAATVIDLAKDGIPLLLDDGGRDEVVRSYIREARKVCHDLEDACEGIERHFRTHRDSAANDKPGMFEPLPVYCDVTSPDFSYEKFMDTTHDPGPIGPEVDAERTKYAEEKEEANDPSIDERLNPGPGGKGPI